MPKLHPVELLAEAGIVTEIVPASEGRGALWQGADLEYYDAVMPARFRTVVSLYPWGSKYQLESQTTNLHLIEMYDSETVDEVCVWSAARIVHEGRDHGDVLVHCQAGMNRSALVTGAALILDGMTGSDAIALLKARRPIVLSNLTFERWLRRATRP